MHNRWKVAAETAAVFVINKPSCSCSLYVLNASARTHNVDTRHERHRLIANVKRNRAEFGLFFFTVAASGLPRGRYSGQEKWKDRLKEIPEENLGKSRKIILSQASIYVSLSLPFHYALRWSRSLCDCIFQRLCVFSFLAWRALVPRRIYTAP